MMWYTLNYEKRDEPDDQTRLGGERQWNNEAWRKPWLERLERRE
jgi:hypothetical protein